MSNQIRGRPKLLDQDIARAEIRRYFATSRVSLRQLASRVGLRGHAALSRFLSGKQKVSLETILMLCTELGIEGRPYERILQSQIPRAFLPIGSKNDEVGTQNARRSESHRSRLVRFFYDDKMRIIYDTLKILEKADAKEIRYALHPKVLCSFAEIESSLSRLIEMGLVSKDGDHWRVIDRKQDIVIPSKYSTEVGKKIIRHSLATCHQFVEEPMDVRMMRSVITTLHAPRGNAVGKVRDTLLKLQDDILSLQGNKDDTVVEVFFSVVELANKGRVTNSCKQR